MIKHLSFDLWLTLIESHPFFKIKRAEYFLNHYNPGGYSLEEIRKIILTIEKSCDRLNEYFGGKIPSNLMYKKILERLGFVKADLTDNFLGKVQNEVNSLFLSFPPKLIDIQIPELLRKLKKDHYTLCISSNTGFIDGVIVTKVLENYGIAACFDYLVYSDEIAASKPSPLFFHKVLELSGCRKEEILHIGDNLKTDIEGALNFGFQAYHYTKQINIIDDLYQFLLR